MAVVGDADTLGDGVGPGTGACVGDTDTLGDNVGLEVGIVVGPCAGAST